MNPRRAAAAHVFVDDVVAPQLSEEDRHHLARVLRLRTGEAVTVSDGKGSWRPCTMTGPDLNLAPTGDVGFIVQEHPEIAVAFAVTKGDRPELVVQKLTELGVDHIVPVLTDRTVVRWGSDKVLRNHERLLKVVREAAMQSRAVYLPRLHVPVHGLGELVEMMFGLGATMALAEPEGEPLTSDITAIAIGPEGGFSPEECAMVQRHVVLPGGILRAETAAIAAGVMLIDQRQKMTRR